MVTFHKLMKMEIFKLFNEWPKTPEKENNLKNTQCDCSLLKNQISEKDAIIKTQEINLNDSKSKIESLCEQNNETTSKIKELEIQIKKIHEKENSLKNELAYFQSERDKYKEQVEVTMLHLKNVEFSFNDVHTKYERAKSIIEDLKANETKLQQCIRLYEETTDILIQQYTNLKKYSMKQFEEANIYVNALNQDRECIIAQLQGKIRKLEVTTAALEQNLQQKSLENEQLSIVCDELISKQSGYYVHNVKDIVQI